MQIFSFPFYTTKSQQFRFDSRSEGFQDWNLYCAPNRFLPFMIKKPTNRQLIDCIKIFSLEDEENPVQVLQPADINYKMYSDAFYDYIFYYAAIVQNMNLPCGKYYLEISGQYSEVFTVANQVQLGRMLEINWRHDSNIGGLIYQNGFFQRVFLDSAILEPKYKTDQEGDEDGFGSFILTFASTIKTLKLEAGLLPEFLVDALALLPNHNQVNIGQYSKVKQIEMDPDWLHAGVFAKVQIQFTEAEPVISKTCAEPLILEEINQEGYVPKAWLCGVDTVEPYWQSTGEAECLQEEFSEVVLEDFDFLVARYSWPATSGRDLDTRTGFIQTGTIQDDKFVGWGQNGGYDTGYLKHAGDQTGDGVEAILFDMDKFTTDYPLSPELIKVTLQAHWYGSRGTGDINVNLTTYKGGTMEFDSVGKNFNNVGGVEVNSEARTKNILNQGSASPYDTIGILEFTKATGSATITIE